MINFDKVNRLIIVAAPVVDVSVQELLNAVRNWESAQENLVQAQVATAAGKDFLGGGLIVGVTLTLLNGWRVQFESRSAPTVCRVTGGNLVALDIDGNPIFPLAYSINVLATIAASSSATLIGADASIDPWAAELPGVYAPGSAGNIIGKIDEKVLDGPSGIDPNLTLREAIRIAVAILAGKTDINGTTVKFRDTADRKDRVTAEMTGSKRTTVTLDGSD